MNTENQQKPCLVKTDQGFSVNYKEKFLYSKYNPAKSILQKIESLEILPGSVILVISPVLCYGLSELIKKLPENCAVLLCERDKKLRDISKEYSNLAGQCDGSFAILEDDELFNLPVILQKPSYVFKSGFSLGELGSYRRVIRIDFSAGSQFYSDFYNELESACVNSIKQFWTNRITLTKFGRRFSQNVFRNLKSLSDSTPLENYIGAVSKPIVVFGAGESSEIGAEKIKICRNDYFVLCADTAFPMLVSYGIVPDGIVIDEAQSVIAESFIGAELAKISDVNGEKHGVQIFQSLCSLPHVAGINFPKNQITFYATEYDSNNFFENLKSRDFFPPVILPFGSVGITSFYLANLFKSSEDIPVIVYGLDFAFSAGKTHAKGTPAHKRQLRLSNRLKSVENYGACFGQNVIRLNPSETETSSMELSFSTPILQTYKKTFEQVAQNISVLVADWKSVQSGKSKKIDSNDIEEYLNSERLALESLRDILSGKVKIDDRVRDLKIFEICKNREYLFLHFPDGYKFSLSIDFLKRIRGEIDFFLKYIK